MSILSGSLEERSDNRTVTAEREPKVVLEKFDASHGANKEAGVEALDGDLTDT